MDIQLPKKKKSRRGQKDEGMEGKKEMKHQLCHFSLKNIQFSNVASTLVKEISFSFFIIPNFITLYMIFCMWVLSFYCRIPQYPRFTVSPL